MRLTDVLVAGSAWSVFARWLLVVAGGSVAFALCFPGASGDAITVIGGSPLTVLLPLFAVGLLATARVLLRRTQQLVAETPSDEETGLGAEYWTGYVSGFTAARREIRAVRRSLQLRGTPARVDTPLRPD